MTTDFHTPHPFGNDVASAEFNSRLGELDAAIGTAIAAGFVDAATTLDAQAASGQKVLPVASTVGFIVGDSVWVGTPGSGLQETGVIASISAGVSLTLVANLANTHAIGAPVSRSPAEIVNARGVYATLGEYIRSLDLHIFNVKHYGAIGNGVADDTVAIQDACDAANSAGGGLVYVPHGTYLVNHTNRGAGLGLAAILLGADTHLIGAGIGATTIKLAASQPTANYAVIRNRATSGTEENITISDLTVDGNGANQTVYGGGIMFTFVRSVHCERVRVENVFGDANFPPGETFFFDVSLSTDASFIDCEAVGSAGTQGTGFSLNNSNNVRYVNCIGRGMSAGHGFTAWHGRNVAYLNCIAQLNGDSGFNVEVSDEVLFTTCIGGGTSVDASDANVNYPYADNTDLGNTGNGFVINESERVSLVNCIGSDNDNNGMACVAGTGSGSGVRVIGGVYNGNTNYGLYFETAAIAQNSDVSAETEFRGNGLSPGIVGPTTTFTEAGLTAPGMAASTVAFTNPFPFSVKVYVSGGTVTQIQDAGITTGLTSGVFRLGASRTITITYSSAPTWAWVR